MGTSEENAVKRMKGITEGFSQDLIDELMLKGLLGIHDDNNPNEDTSSSTPKEPVVTAESPEAILAGIVKLLNK